MTSRFETLFLIRKSFLPTILVVVCIYLLYMHYTEGYGYINFAVIFLILSMLILFFNFNSLYKIIVEKTGITKVFILNRKREFIPFTSIKSSRLEFVTGAETEAGQITPGFYICIFTLTNGKEFLLTPQQYENYNQLIKQISENRSE